MVGKGVGRDGRGGGGVNCRDGRVSLVWVPVFDHLLNAFWPRTFDGEAFGRWIPVQVRICRLFSAMVKAQVQKI